MGSIVDRDKATHAAEAALYLHRRPHPHSSQHQENEESKDEKCSPTVTKHTSPRNKVYFTS